MTMTTKENAPLVAAGEARSAETQPIKDRIRKMEHTRSHRQTQQNNIIQHPSSKGIEVVNVPRRGLAKGVISIAVARRKLRTKLAIETLAYARR